MKLMNKVLSVKRSWLNGTRDAVKDPLGAVQSSESKITDHSVQCEDVKKVLLGGVNTLITGSADDTYFASIESHAHSLNDFAKFVVNQRLQDATVLDVGANVGLSTIILARNVRRVIAFEPSPVNASFLARNLELNGIDNVDVRLCAASSEAGLLRFHVASFGAGSHVVAQGHVIGQTISFVDVPAVCLDDENLPSIKFIKIDVEGHEPDVLAGARALLARDQPLIYTEVNAWCLSAFAGHSLGAFVLRLWQTFEVSSISADGQLAPLPDAYGFLHDTIVHNRGMADIVLRPRSGVAMPTLQELTWPVQALPAP